LLQTKILLIYNFTFCLVFFSFICFVKGQREAEKAVQNRQKKQLRIFFWCKMAKVKGDIVIDIQRCKGCELCIESCPEETIALSLSINQKGYRYATVVNQSCTGCANCALVCPEAIITVYRKVLKKN